MTAAARPPFPIATIVAVGLLFVLLLVLIGARVVTLHETHVELEALEQARDLDAAIASARIALVDADARQSLYRLTGDAAERERYLGAHAGLGSALDRLAARAARGSDPLHAEAQAMQRAIRAAAGPPAVGDARLGPLAAPLAALSARSAAAVEVQRERTGRSVARGEWLTGGVLTTLLALIAGSALLSTIELRSRRLARDIDDRALAALDAQVADGAHALDQATQDLALSQAQLQGVFDSTVEGIMTVDMATQRITMANQAAAEMFGYPIDWLKGLKLDMLIPPDLRERHRRHLDAFSASATGPRPMGSRRADVRALRSDGSQFPIEASISMATAGQTRFHTVVLRDITQRLEAETRLREAEKRQRNDLRQLMASQMEGQEKERARIARELHDDLQQSLAAIQMDLAAASHTVASDPAAALTQIRNASELADAVIASTRRIVNDLRPPLLDDLGLGPALEALAGQFTRRTGVACEFVDDAADAPWALPGEAQLALYRITQESLNNVAKHADARRVTLKLFRPTPETLALQVDDDGRGIRVRDEGKPGSFGLPGMRERVESLGGILSIQPRQDGGTSVTVEIEMPGSGEPAQPVEAADGPSPGGSRQRRDGPDERARAPAEDDRPGTRTAGLTSRKSSVSPDS